MSHISVYAQDGTNRDIIHVTGRTYDMDSLEVLPFVAITANDEKGLVSDQNGYFALGLRVGDTIAFSHVGYVTSTLVVPDTNHQNDSLYEYIYGARQRDLSILTKTI